MTSQEAFFEQLNTDIRATQCIENPFFKAFRNNEISLEQTKVFADQYYLYIRTFPQILAGLSARVDSEVVRKELAKTVVSELGGGGGEIHFQLFEQACKPLGIELKLLDEAEYFPETIALVEGIRTMFLEDTVETALGGHYTIELSGLPMIKSLYDGFREFPGSDVISLEYFYLHLLIEREHVEWIHTAVQEVAGPNMEADIHRGAIGMATLLGNFWNALHKALVPQPVGV
jgi:pyrroloquinoline-quinone synthase